LTFHGIQADWKEYTYSLLETKRLIELSETVSGKDVAEAQMILNHKAAIEYIVET